MEADPSKFQVMFLGMREQPKFTLEINDVTIPLMDKAKLLGLTVDSKLKFDNHINALCQTKNKKTKTSSLFHMWLNA